MAIAGECPDLGGRQDLDPRVGLDPLAGGDHFVPVEMTADVIPLATPIDDLAARRMVAADPDEAVVRHTRFDASRGRANRFQAVVGCFRHDQEGGPRRFGQPVMLYDASVGKELAQRLLLVLRRRARSRTRPAPRCPTRI